MKIKKFKTCILLSVIAIISMQVISYAAYTQNTNKSNEITYKNFNQDEAILSTEESDTLDLINSYRRANGLQSLKSNHDLQEVAKIKAEDIVNNDYFAHDSDELGTPFEMLSSNGINYKIAGENLAGNTTPERAVQAWINSESHRANILEEKFEYTGIYVIDSEIYGKVFVQLFVGV